jgi:NADP-dependent 3-hydroxy acid dehydrogenase YdfG
MEIGMEFKNVAITGHTNGIGKGLHDYFSSKGSRVKGFSLTNGFDISKKENIDHIIELTSKCDLFINNAHCDYQQIALAKLWQQQHWDSNHFIINVSSIASEPFADVPTVMPWLAPYGEEKYALNKISWDINHSGSTCKSILIMPGVVATNFYNRYDTEDNNGQELYETIMSTNSIIEVQDLVKSIELVLQSINGRNFISSFTLLNGY